MPCRVQREVEEFLHRHPAIADIQVGVGGRACLPLRLALHAVRPQPVRLGLPSKGALPAAWAAACRCLGCLMPSTEKSCAPGSASGKQRRCCRLLQAPQVGFASQTAVWADLICTRLVQGGAAPHQRRGAAGLVQGQDCPLQDPAPLEGEQRRRACLLAGWPAGKGRSVRL